MALRIGTNGNNSLLGTNQSDLIFGLGGNDIINAGAGNDLVFAGAGADSIFAGDGNDIVYAGIGNDTAAGGAGNDQLFGDGGDDMLDGGVGNDVVDGGSGNDTLIFSAAGQAQLDRYIGGSGNDSLIVELTAARWEDAAVKADIRAYLTSVTAGNTGAFLLQSLGLQASSIESLVVKVDGVIIDPFADLRIFPRGSADSYTTGENDVLNVSPGTGLGSLVSNDDTGTGVFVVSLVDAPARGNLLLNSDGTFSFDPGVDFDFLAEGDTTTETFTYRITNNAGSSDPVTVTINVTGTNDIPEISGTFTAPSAREDFANNDASGRAIVTDADDGQSGVGNPGEYDTDYGTLELSADGTWNFTLANDSLAVQSLSENEIVNLQFAVQTIDGTSAGSISVLVEGTDDIAVITGDTSDTITLPFDSPVANGAVLVTDIDEGESGMVAATYDGAHGTLDMNANGEWMYMFTDFAAFEANEDLSALFEVIAVETLGGTQFNINVNIFEFDLQM